LKLSKYGFFLFTIVTHSVWGQFSAPDSDLTRITTEDGYLFPVEPGNNNLLAGTMGELRSNHFHSGIDVRTNGRIGLPVLSSQKGYVSRVSISSGGYGNALYVTHPNGQTTVYGHLDRFSDKIADYARNEQYRKKTFSLNLYPTPGQFPVSRGDTIAFSGNSGSSAGPHLHFDIRDRNNDALNPLVFNFPEVIDNTPPIVQKVALRTIDINSRINDQFGRFEFYVVKDGDNYKLPYPILASGNIGVEFLGYDRLDNSRAKCGINHIEMAANGNIIFRQLIDKVNFGETRNILTLMDYPTLQESGERFNKLFIDDGNDLPYYDRSLGKGIIKVKDTNVPLRILLRDTYGNQSQINLTLQPSNLTEKVNILSAPKKPLSYQVLENVLEVDAQKHLGDTLQVFSGKTSNKITPTYGNDRANVFLIDMRKMLPDSVKINGQTLVTHFKDFVPSGLSYKYYSDPVDITFPKGSLYDSVFLTVHHKMDDREIFSIGDARYPMDRSITITLKPTLNYSEKFSVYKLSGRYYQYMGGNWANGKISFTTREFGDFILLEDTNAPSITKISVNSAAARFRIKDDLSGISYFGANINGEWLLMNYDPKISTIWAERLDNSKPLQGDFSLKVVDNAGNENIYQQKIP